MGKRGCHALDSVGLAEDSDALLALEARFQGFTA
jgi:hypothetical protein